MLQSFSHSRRLSFFIFFICFDANDNNETDSAATEPTLKPNTHKNLTLQKKVHHSLPPHHPSSPPKAAFGVFQQQQQLAERRHHVVHYSQRELHFIIPLIRLITALATTLAIDMTIDLQQSAHLAAQDHRDLRELAVFYRAFCKVNSTNS